MVGALLLGLALAVRALQSPADDLAVYRGGGATLLSGRSPYAGPVAHGMAFTYPPFAALLFAPLARLPWTLCKAAALVGNCALLFFVAARSWRCVGTFAGSSLGAAAVVTASAGMLTQPVRSNVHAGQVNLVLLALVVADLAGRDQRRLRGAGLGVAAGIKLTPLFFLLHLLTVRRYRTAALAGGTFAATVLFGLVVPGSAYRYWSSGLFADTGRIYLDPASTHNQSLRGLVLRAGLTGWSGLAVWTALAFLVSLGALLAAARAIRLGDRLLAVTVCGLGATAVSPWSWVHHWVWIVPLAVIAADRVIRVRARTPWTVLLLLLPLTLPQVGALVDPPDGAGPPVLTSGPGALLLGNVYLLLLGGTVLLCTLEGSAHPGSDKHRPEPPAA
ncbi:MAG TPA: glycosyltransferase 87 family protein, partial [Kineosporiaceae bacterium]|nr:glycosyltransferase 87 family protein [Kineosporiaceae bacterium]